MTRVSGAACVELNTPRGGLGEHDARRGQLENPGKSSARAHLRSSKRSSVRRVSATSRDRKHADAARVRLRDVTRALGRSGRTKRTLAGSMLAGCRIQGSREQPGGLRVVGGIRGGSPPRISLRDSKRLSTREDVARGAHVGRESGVLCPCRSREPQKTSEGPKDSLMRARDLETDRGSRLITVFQTVEMSGLVYGTLAPKKRLKLCFVLCSEL